jgi:hypothetical protein
MRTKIISAVAHNLHAQISRHMVNLEVLLESPRSIPEHSDYVSEVERHLAAIAECEDRLQVLEKYFNKQ